VEAKSYVWKDGDPDWRPAGEHPELSAILSDLAGASGVKSALAALADLKELAAAGSVEAPRKARRPLPPPRKARLGQLAERPTETGELRRAGRYLLVEELGAGGVFQTHLACDDSAPRRWVVIKRLLPWLADDQGAAVAVLECARIWALHAHANVRSPLHVDRIGGELLVVAEYVHGPAITDLLPRRPPALVVADIGAQAAEGIDMIHQHRDAAVDALGAIHGQVTPANLLLRTDGVLKVADAYVNAALRRHSVTSMTKLPFAYMSPEKVRSEEIDGRSDLFSLGIVLWELLAGRPLFRADSDFETLERVRDANIPRLSSGTDANVASVEAVVMKALAKRRDDRFATAGEMAMALRRILLDHPDGTDIAGRSTRVATYLEHTFGGPNAYYEQRLARAERAVAEQQL
jgi:serine/threonine protein kinase